MMVAGLSTDHASIHSNKSLIGKETQPAYPRDFFRGRARWTLRRASANAIVTGENHEPLPHDHPKFLRLATNQCG
jgi:hypothetical protein